MQPPSPPSVRTDNSAEALGRILQSDPSGTYPSMDAATRERYEHACLELAAWSKRTPSEVAHAAVQLSQEHDAGDARGRHVGTHLLAEGRPLLEARLGCRVPGSVRIGRRVKRHAEGLYVGTLLVLTLVFLGGIGLLLPWEEPLHRVLFLALLALPVLRFVHDPFDALLASRYQNLEPLSRLEPAQALSEDTRTLVVTPLLITNVEDIDAQLRKLEINYQGNVSPHVLFAVLTDFADAPAKDMPGDQELLARMERGIHELNERHGHRELPRFLCLHRERRWNPVADRWMGWERKRGKLEELNHLLLGASGTSYTGALPAALHSIRYVLTLDADNQLLPGSVAVMAAILHHPLNQARFDASGRRVVAGYSMLQPSMGDGPSRERWLSSGAWPLSIIHSKRGHRTPTATHLSQALFGVGDFLGKGLYDVAAFTRSLEGRIPGNSVLSHDKLEGMYARVALATDVVLFEGQPANMANAASIWHRWIRGDWQLLPWLLPWVPSREGRWVRNDLPLLDRWKLLTDILRSLNSPATLAALVSGWLMFPAHQLGAWTLIASLWIGRGFLAFRVGKLRSRLRQGSFATRVRHLVFALPQLAGDLLAAVGLLIPTCCIVLDATARASYRMVANRRRILDWTTNAQSARVGKGRGLQMSRELWQSAVLTVLILGVLGGFHAAALPWALPLFLVWLPLMALNIRNSQTASPGARTVLPAGIEPLRVLARRSWAFYEHLDTTGRELPRLTLSEDGVRGDAPGVSPTDIALWLVAPLSAYHLGYMTLEEWVARLKESLTAVEGLERHRGHLFVRYDARSLQPLERRTAPAESGMLSATLIVIERALRAARSTPASSQVLRQGLADTLAVLCEDLPAHLQSTLPSLRAKVVERTASTEDVLAEVQRQLALLTELPAKPLERLQQQLARLAHVSRPAAGRDTEHLVRQLEEAEARIYSLREQMDFACFDALPPAESAGTPLAGFLAISRREAATTTWLKVIAPSSPVHTADRDTLTGRVMPSLFLWYPPATLLGQTALTAVDAAIAQGATPSLSLLALRFRPTQARENLDRLISLGARGGYGLYDAIQVTPGSEQAVAQHVYTYRAQAITLAAVANLACNDVLVDHFHHHWQTGWVEGLVYETAEAR
ncbi:hypothetical protein [Stigmatella erecta]|uniref:Cyclic beta-1,2-glucan synthetase n=1 Tax=Stigmatella erecta TaxID=83460 RepID=A0A1I0ASX7_9BACT|nr:hypothetical protein [Stigmatella erecta]SES97027.1 cyclic beta-1,2-glucan synthetase [Stigmatella erecta]